MYILIQIWLCGKVGDKKIFTLPISRNKTIYIFLALAWNAFNFFFSFHAIGYEKITSFEILKWLFSQIYKDKWLRDLWKIKTESQEVLGGLPQTSKMECFSTTVNNF